MPESLGIVKFLLSENDPGKLGACAAEVTFVGRSNVGKSSLLNALFRKDLARVSSWPGRTRSINVFQAGADRWLVDLPGYGFAQGPEAERARWRKMIEAYLTGRPHLRMVFVLIDAKVGPTSLDLRMIAWLKAMRLRRRVVATKADQVKPSRAVTQRREVAKVLGMQPADLAWVSARDGAGIVELRGEVAAMLRS